MCASEYHIDTQRVCARTSLLVCVCVCTISVYVRTIKQDYLFQARTRIGNNEDHDDDDEQAATMAG